MNPIEEMLKEINFQLRSNQEFIESNETIVSNPSDCEVSLAEYSEAIAYYNYAQTRKIGLERIKELAYRAQYYIETLEKKNWEEAEEMEEEE